MVRFSMGIVLFNIYNRNLYSQHFVTFSDSSGQSTLHFSFSLQYDMLHFLFIKFVIAFKRAG